MTSPSTPGTGCGGQTGRMTSFNSEVGDITTQRVDAIVNAASTAMRGGAGVDGAIHRAGGPAILRDCIARFPRGLATGDAGWTTAGDLPARWVIHTVGPNYSRGNTDGRLLESCYRRALEVADELGARSIAFPLVGSGAYGWSLEEAIKLAVDGVTLTPTAVEEVRFVHPQAITAGRLSWELTKFTPLRILQGIAVLHERGYHRIRAYPGMSPSGIYWRVTVAGNEPPVGDPGAGPGGVRRIDYTSGALTQFAGGTVTRLTRPTDVADLMLEALPGVQPHRDDPAYVDWYAGMLYQTELMNRLPVSFSDDLEQLPGWEIGWGSHHYYPRPPAIPDFTPS